MEVRGGDPERRRDHKRIFASEIDPAENVGVGRVNRREEAERTGARVAVRLARTDVRQTFERVRGVPVGRRLRAAMVIGDRMTQDSVKPGASAGGVFELSRALGCAGQSLLKNVLGVSFPCDAASNETQEARALGR